MPLPLIALACALALQDTVVVLGSKERDLTGDGKPETLRLVGVGPSLDSLNVTLSIESDGKRIYETQFAPLTRKISFDGPLRHRTRTEHRAFLKEYGGWIFEEAQFKAPTEFVLLWRGAGPEFVSDIPRVIGRERGRLTIADSMAAERTWEEIQLSGVTVFQFSPGGDRVEAIAWSSRDQRFYRLLECC